MNVTEPGLRALTDSRSWQRGVDYFESGLVLSLREEKDRLIAEVEGTRPTPYRVVLHEIDGEIEGECTCPMGEAGVFCKHCVATGLAYLSSRKGEPGAPVDVERGPRVTSLDDLRQYLSGLNKAELVDIVAGQAAADGALWRDLSPVSYTHLRAHET